MPTVSGRQQSTRRGRPSILGGRHHAPGSGRFGQGRDVGNPSIRQSCAPMRNHARSLNLLARGYLIPPDANCPLRQYSAGLRTAHTASVSSVLTDPIDRGPEHRVVRPARSSRRQPPTGVPTPNCRPSSRPGQVEDGRNLIHSPNVRTYAQTTRGHWMPAVSPLLIEGDESWFRRQPYSRVRKPHTVAVSGALTPHIVQEPCHRVDHPPRSHRRRVPTRTTLPNHLRSVDSSARSFASFRSARLHPWPLDSRSPEGWVMRGAW